MEFPCRRRRFAILAAILLIVPVGAASAGWREDLGTFRIGMLADPGSGRLVAGLADIRQAYSTALGMPVQIFVARDYAALIDAHATSRIDYAVYSTLAYATAERLCACVEPLAARRGREGDIGVRAVLLARGSVADGEEGLAEARIALSRSDSLAGSILPAAALDAGVGPPGLKSDRVIETESDSDAVDRFLSGSVDGLFGWSPSRETPDVRPDEGTFALLSEAGAREINVRWTSQLLRYGPHAVRSGIDEEAKAILRTFLTGLAANKPDIQELLTGSHEDNFVDVTAADYLYAGALIDRIAEK